MDESRLSEMTIEEKIALCSGADFWHTKAMEQYGIPAIMMADGPHGLRKQENSTDMLGINRAVPATSFPTAAATACSWDEALLGEIGRAIAREAAANGVSMLLGPGANIKRSPLCGRNFEYFSEDPCLTGRLAAGYIRGVQETGVAASLKHFAFNSQEYKRFSSDSVMDERTMREIYLAGFETAVREGRPGTVMCAYNKINGEHCSDSRMLLTDILRGEWGFDGLVVTDWGAMSDRIRGFEAGCDLNMPGGSAYMEREALEAVREGRLDEACVDRCAQRVAALARRGVQAVKDAPAADMEAHEALARRAAAQSAVLLKNEGGLLPVASLEDVVFIGHMAKQLRYQGAGSSHINAWRVTSACEACPQTPWAQGCREDGSTDDALMDAAVRAARRAKTAVVFAGLPDRDESEGFDREHMGMPEGHVRMIREVAKANPDTVVVLLCGSAVETPWADDVRAILYMGLPGQAGGAAIADLLTGRSVPCGKLAESWPMRYEDCVCASYYAGGRKDAHYREGLYVGYRYYTSAGVPVRYPFGYGLSYTSFAYSGLQIEGDTVRCTVRNTGGVAAKEIVQLYIAPPPGPVYRPVRELRDFAKVHLEPGESRTVSFRLNDRSFALWQDGWVIPGGAYTVLVGGSSEDLPLSAVVHRDGGACRGDDLPAWYASPKGAPSHGDFERLVGHAVTQKPLRRGEFTMENSVMEMKDHSLVMKLLYKGVEMFIARDVGGKKDDATFRMMMTSAADASLSGMRINSGMRDGVLEGLLEMANGHYLRGVLRMLGRR